METLGPKPELRWVKLTELYIPTEYQRSTQSEASRRSIGRLTANFNWSECGALIVCPLKGAKPPQYAVIDGQHRVKAALGRSDIGEMPCMVLAEKITKEQAKNFIAINMNRVSLNPLAAFHARVVAADGDAVAVAALLEQCTIAMCIAPVGAKELLPRTTQAIGTLMALKRDYTEKQIKWVLNILPEAYPKQNGVLSANMLKVMAAFIKAYPVCDKDAVLEALRDTRIDQLESDARAYRAISPCPMPTAMLKVIEKKYLKYARSA